MNYNSKCCIIFFTLLFLSSTLLAQQNSTRPPDPNNPVPENMVVPGGWEIRLDEPDPDVTVGSDAETADIFFVNMKPGWHVTTGPRAIFYHPASTAGGTYRASAKIHLFNPKDRNEAFGIFFGGKNLKEDNYSYTYFLLRNSGEYLIKKRIGEETEVIKDWTAAPSMVPYEDTTKSSVPNTLSLEVRSDAVDFFVNGEKVDSIPKSDLATDGVVGLRINHMLNLHVEDLSVEKL